MARRRPGAEVDRGIHVTECGLMIYIYNMYDRVSKSGSVGDNWPQQLVPQAVECDQMGTDTSFICDG